MAYTECQGIIAKLIDTIDGGEHLRTDSVLRCYVCTGQSSRWYEFVTGNSQYAIKYLGGGEVELHGTGVAGEDFTDARGRVWHGSVVDTDVHSSQCGLIIHLIGWGRSGKQNAVATIEGLGK